MVVESCMYLCLFILHSSSLADFFKRQRLLLIVTVFYSLLTPSSCLQAYLVAIATLMLAFTQVRRVSQSLTWREGGGGRGMTSLVRLLFVRAIRRYYDQLIGVLRMKREIRAISPFLQFSSFTSSLSNFSPPGAYVHVHTCT